MSDNILPAIGGTGPLLQRDYWAVLSECKWKPSALMAHIRAHFCELPPPALVKFAAPQGLSEGQELEIALLPAQRCRVRVVHADLQSLTLATLEGHPEAGRITFGAYRNSAGEVIVHIRSRARSSNTTSRLGFIAVGEAMQTNTWTDFINRTAALVGAKIRDSIHADTVRVEELPEDDAALKLPTFTARGD